MKVSVKRMIPNPPIHWVSERQMSMPLLHRSTSRITVAPVVVNPDIASKKASLTLSGVSQRMKGNMPNSEKTIHTIEASSMPSRRFSILFSGREKKLNDSPVNSVSTMAMANAILSCSWLSNDTVSGNAIKPASIIRSWPSTFSTIA